MVDQVQNFGNTARSLARNPLGIIALFIVLVYGFASFVTISAGSLSSAERLPLIYFLIVFPVLVLAVFGWLVSRHSGKLFAPSDFKDEQNYVKMQMAVVASLTAATTKTEHTSAIELGRIVETARSIGPNNAIMEDGWRNRILWVDDRPENNVFERQAFEAVGLQFTLATSTNEALERLSSNNYGAIISDMGRREGPREGYVLLDRLRQQGDRTPLFFYASSNEPEHKRETREHGGQGCTNNAQELFQMVTKAIVVGQRG
jgi:CheY-like chemotaxis protein